MRISILLICLAVGLQGHCLGQANRTDLRSYVPEGSFPDNSSVVRDPWTGKVYRQQVVTKQVPTDTTLAHQAVAAPADRQSAKSNLQQQPARRWQYVPLTSNEYQWRKVDPSSAFGYRWVRVPVTRWIPQLVSLPAQPAAQNWRPAEPAVAKPGAIREETATVTVRQVVLREVPEARLPAVRATEPQGTRGGSVLSRPISRTAGLPVRESLARLDATGANVRSIGQEEANPQVERPTQLAQAASVPPRAVGQTAMRPTVLR